MTGLSFLYNISNEYWSKEKFHISLIHNIQIHAFPKHFSQKSFKL